MRLTKRSQWGAARRWHSGFTRMKSFNKDSLLCCSQSGSVVPGRSGIYYLISDLPAEWDGGEVMACCMLLCSTESFPDGCDLWTSHNTGTNEHHSPCFGWSSGVWAPVWSLRSEWRTLEGRSWWLRNGLKMQAGCPATVFNKEKIQHEQS